MSASSATQSRRAVSDTGKIPLLSRLSLSPNKRAPEATPFVDARPITHVPMAVGVAPARASTSRLEKGEQTMVNAAPKKRHQWSDASTPILDEHEHGRRLGKVPQAVTDVSQRHPNVNTIRPPKGSTDLARTQNGDAQPIAIMPTGPELQSPSPSRARRPIYPALASPPNDHPRDPVTSRPDSLANSSFERQRTATLKTEYESRRPRLNIVHDSPPRVNGDHRPATMQIIASSDGSKDQSDRTAPGEKAAYRFDKQGRPLMSARRSATSSSKTVTRRNSTSRSTSKSSLPSPSSPDSSKVTPSKKLPEHGLTEASAYAKAISTHLVRPGTQEGGSREITPDKPTRQPAHTQIERPLPKPPNAIMEAARPPHLSQPALAPHVTKDDRRSGPPQPKPARVDLSGEPQKIDFDFPRSPTIPALTDPRGQGTGKSSRDRVAGRPALVAVTSAVAGSVDASAVHHRQRWTSGDDGGNALRPPGKVALQHLLAQPRIQAALLSTISINAFLSLTGSSEMIRRRFTGETVGRWVLREWAVHVPSPFGARWPNLTVWEGFLESLLHDPATYSTYPAKWHNLLRHLSLSHSLVILFLRNLPPSCFPNHSLLPFEDEGPSSTSIPFSPSSTSLASMGQPRSRVGSVAGSDNASLAPSSKPPRRERIIEIVMPEPLAAQPQEEIIAPEMNTKPIRRRGSISSLASAASLSFGRRRSNSNAADMRPASRASSYAPLAEPTASMASGKAAPPPVSYPSAKRYGFKGPHDGLPRSRSSSIAPRPASIFSMQTSPTVSSYAPRMSFGTDARPPNIYEVSQTAWPAPPPLSVKPRSSFGSADSHRKSDREQNSPGPSRRTAFPLSPPARCEPAFDRPMPFIPGRVPVLRVFVPLSETVRRWPSAEGAMAAIEELEKCGARKRMQLGDLVVNTAIRAPRTTEHVLVFVPFVKHVLVPLQYLHVSTGHLPSYVDAFALPPSYYYPFLPAPQVIYLNLGPYREQGRRSMRLASDRRDMTIASGAKISAKRYLYVAGVEITANDKAAAEWQGMVTLEAEGTAEGKSDLEARFGLDRNKQAALAPWEIIKEKSMGGTVWLRLVKEKPA